MTEGPASLHVEWCGPEHAETVHRLTQAAFHEQAALVPPSGAGSETVDEVREELDRHPGALGSAAFRPVACLRLAIEPPGAHVRRLAVLPELRGRGYGRAMMAWAEAAAVREGASEVTIGVRLALPANIAFFRRLGYEACGEHAHRGFDHPTWLALRKRL